VKAQISEAGIQQRRAFERLTDRSRNQDLAAVSRKADPSRGIDGDAHVTRVGHRREARVETDPDQHN